MTARTAIDLSGGHKLVNPLGLAISPDGKLGVVALSIANTVAVVDLTANKVLARIDVGICPYGVAISGDGRTALVSIFGGSRPKAGDKTESSGGSPVAVDEHGVALRGTVSVIDLKTMQTVGEIMTRIHPETMATSPDGKLAYVVDDSGDGVSEIDIARRAVVAHFDTKPSPKLPYGSLTNCVAFSTDGKTLFTANAGNNAIGMFDLGVRSTAFMRKASDDGRLKPGLQTLAFIPGGRLSRFGMRTRQRPLYRQRLWLLRQSAEGCAAGHGGGAGADDANCRARFSFRRNPAGHSGGRARRPAPPGPGAHGRAFHDPARCLHHQGEQKVRPGAGRRRPGAIAIRGCASSRGPSRPTTMP